MIMEPEYITIVEGPTPEFRRTPEFALNSILEGPRDAMTVYCEMRTLNGRAIVDRCKDAWDEGRPVRLDYPDKMRLRKEIDVIALRLEEIEEGMVLQVWVNHPLKVVEEEDESDDIY